MMVCGDSSSRTRTATCCFSVVLAREGRIGPRPASARRNRTRPSRSSFVESTQDSTRPQLATISHGPATGSGVPCMRRGLPNALSLPRMTSDFFSQGTASRTSLLVRRLRRMSSLQTSWFSVGGDWSERSADMLLDGWRFWGSAPTGPRFKDLMRPGDHNPSALLEPASGCSRIQAGLMQAISRWISLAPSDDSGERRQIRKVKSASCLARR